MNAKILNFFLIKVSSYLYTKYLKRFSKNFAQISEEILDENSKIIKIDRIQKLRKFDKVY